MTLSKLIEKANKGYSLNLNSEQQGVLKDRLRMSGVPNTIENKAISGTMGVILSVASSVKPNKALETYSRLKQPTFKDVSDKCPRCGNRMIKADIVTRKVSYCVNCKIVLPLPVN